MKQNVIIIMSDSLRRDHVNVYGVPPPWRRPGHENEPFIRTPALDALAEDAMLFDRAYIASYPTIPNRTDLYTGRYGFAYRGWQPSGARGCDPTRTRQRPRIHYGPLF